MRIYVPDYAGSRTTALEWHRCVSNLSFNLRVVYGGAERRA